MRTMGRVFEPNGLNAIFAVIAAKVATLAGGYDSFIASATATVALLYAVVLFLTASVRFVKEVKTSGKGNDVERG